MSTKSLFTLTTILVLGSHSMAQTYRDSGRYEPPADCSTQSRTLNLTQCLTAGTAAVAGGAGATHHGIHAARNFSDAEKLEKANTKPVFGHDPKSPPAPIDSVQATARTFTEGDKITITYHLSEAANRQRHIRIYTDRAESAESSASLERTLAADAASWKKDTVTDTHRDAQGNITGTTTRVVDVPPDMAAARRHESNAEDFDREAISHRVEVAETRRGKKIAFYNMEAVIDGETGTRNAAKAFIEAEQETKGGKIISMLRLPAEINKSVKQISKVGMTRVASAVVSGVMGAGVAINEVINATISTQINKVLPESYRPPMNTRGYR